MRLRSLRFVADLACVVFEVAHDGWKDRASLRVGQAFGHAVANRGHQRVGGAEVDAHRDPPLVRVGRIAGL